ncbi:uncharacterized protein LOC112347026 [Selaginella moellendorffii]|uniref:uncharacterized protein LOC112347026 n=1 Tax=Selaginella moellendorffii TaxID=88036 RepID=UPI000D1C7863|nr:uncharacterized protein LOC112347026 [Selaginella moellendorffii]|eukprot:XP_024532895.1 uncharacterized protein LOC112347026 [Selaginella moellendorffii]
MALRLLMLLACGYILAMHGIAAEAISAGAPGSSDRVGVLRVLASSSSNSNSSSRIALSAFYPDRTIGPSGWDYFRAEIPVSFSVLSIILTKKRWTSQGSGPLVCFQFGGLPLPSAPVESLEVAIKMAGERRNVSTTGKCALFQESVHINMTNEQIVSGVLYIGTFSDPSPHRTQSTMISRGPTYNFEAQVAVSVCKDNFAGEVCNRSVSVLSSSSSSEFSVSGVERIANGTSQASGNTSSWRILLGNCVARGEWTFFLLQIPDLVSSLEIRVDTDAAVSDMKLAARHEALPQLSDVSTGNQTQLVIEAPMKGAWYIGVTGDNSTGGSNSCFSLLWRIQDCVAGYGGAGCNSPSIPLERVVSRASESPFDSSFLPATKTSTKSGWFSWKLLNVQAVNTTLRWLYLNLEVPNGAAGSVLSFEVHFPEASLIEAYARFKGYPTLESWDFRHTSKNNKSLSFDVTYPAEGFWSIGVRHSLAVEAALKFRVHLHGCVDSCSHHGSCTTRYEASRLSFYSFCNCDRTHGGIDCSEKLLSLSARSLQIAALVGSNAAAAFPSFWALRQKAMSEWLIYTTSGIASAIYHSCDAGGWCALSYDTLQFLDFWLSFLAVIFTCLYLAEVLGLTKPTLHVAAAVITAIIAKNKDRTSARSALLVIGIGAAVLLLGLLWELWGQNRLRRCQPFRLQSIRLYSLELQRSALVKKLRQRFVWAYVGIGVMIVAFAGVCWKQETARNYWIWHSLWHVSIYTGAFFLLFSVIPEESTTPEAVPSDETDTFMNGR